MKNEVVRAFASDKFGNVRVVLIGENEEPYFVGKDVTEALGYLEPRSAVSKKVDFEDRAVAKIATPSGTQEMTCINESGLYSLILGSKLPSAKEFKRWVTSEVLPAIRKTGNYTGDNTQLLSMEDMMIAQLNEHKKIKEQLNQVNSNSARAVSIAEHVEEKLDKQMTINSTQQKHIQDAVKKKVSERLNRCKEFNNSFDSGEHKAQFFSSLYGDLKRRFGVPTYKDILYIHYDDALSYVKNWIEPHEIR